MKFRWILAGGCVVGLGIGLILRPLPVPESQPLTAIHRAPFELVSASSPKVNVASGIAAPRSVVQKVDLKGVLNSSKSLREFIATAKLHPQSGGFYWAVQATKLCENHAFLVNQTLQRGRKMESPQMIDARARIIEECRDVDYKASAINSLMAEGESLNDPDIRLVRERNKLYEESDYKGVIDSLLESVDPLTLAVAGSDLFYSGLKGPSAQKEYFDGKWYFGPEVEDLAMAEGLALCDLGLQCDQTRFEVALTCANTGRCYSDYPAMISDWVANEPGRSERIDALRTNLVEALTTHNVYAFLPR